MVRPVLLKILCDMVVELGGSKPRKKLEAFFSRWLASIVLEGSGKLPGTIMAKSCTQLWDLNLYCVSARQDVRTAAIAALLLRPQPTFPLDSRPTPQRKFISDNSEVKQKSMILQVRPKGEITLIILL